MPLGGQGEGLGPGSAVQLGWQGWGRLSWPCLCPGASRPPLPADCDFPLADASDLQGRQLLAGLDKVASDLDRQEKAITGTLRPPLEQGRAVQDSAERAKDLKVPQAGPLAPCSRSYPQGKSWCSIGTACTLH